MVMHKVKSTKVIVFGATGNAGRCLVAAGLKLGHEVSAFVRSSSKLKAIIGQDFNQVRVFEGDALDEQAVGKAMAGHNACVNAAASREDAKVFEAICRNIVSCAENSLDEPKRLWLFGGLPGLNVPHTKTMGSDLMGMRPILRSHKANYQLLKTSRLDWSFMCPGPMTFDIGPGSGKKLHVTTEFMPYEIGRWSRYLPKFLHPFIMLAKMNDLIVSYDDVASLVMSNLEPGGPYSKKRVGLMYKK